MRTRTEIALDIRSAIQTCEQFRHLNDEQNQTLLMEACVFLIKDAVKAFGLDPKKRINVFGPETMGMHMVDMITDAFHQGQLEECEDVSTFTLKKGIRPRTFYLLVNPPAEVCGGQNLWIDETLRHADTLQRAGIVIKQLGIKITGVAVLHYYRHLGQTVVPEQKIVSIEQRYA